MIAIPQISKNPPAIYRIVGIFIPVSGVGVSGVSFITKLVTEQSAFTSNTILSVLI